MESAPLSARSAKAWTWTFSPNSREIILYRSLRTGHVGEGEYLRGRSTTGAKYKKKITLSKRHQPGVGGGGGGTNFHPPILISETHQHGNRVARTPSFWLLNPPALFNHIRSIEELQCCRFGPSGNLSVDRQMRILSIRCCCRAPCGAS